VGIPYSDPIADGPVIQASYTRALDKKVKLAQILKMLGEVTGASTSTSHRRDAGATSTLAAPVVTMVSYAIIYRHGLAKYVADAQAAGVAGAIVPDLLVEEAGELAAICQAADFSLIQLVTPTTPRERAVRIAQTSTGFLYYVSVTGITGERTELPPALLENVSWLRTKTDLPICIGFGISRPEHVKLLYPAADGLIVGSAIVRRVAEAASQPRPAVLKDVGEYAASLLAACR
jgi:tryptophan synthase alpha chain